MAGAVANGPMLCSHAYGSRGKKGNDLQGRLASSRLPCPRIGMFDPCKRTEELKMRNVEANSWRTRRVPRREQELLPLSSRVPGKGTFLLEEGILQHEDNLISMWIKRGIERKTKTVCTIGPSTSTREMIWELADAGMNVARLNMSHGDHASHKKSY